MLINTCSQSIKKPTKHTLINWIICSRKWEFGIANQKLVLYILTLVPDSEPMPMGAHFYVYIHYYSLTFVFAHIKGIDSFSELGSVVISVTNDHSDSWVADLTTHWSRYFQWIGGYLLPIQWSGHTYDTCMVDTKSFISVSTQNGVLVVWIFLLRWNILDCVTNLFIFINWGSKAWAQLRGLESICYMNCESIPWAFIWWRSAISCFNSYVPCLLLWFSNAMKKIHTMQSHSASKLINF